MRHLFIIWLTMVVEVSAHAATARPSWVVNEIYDYNHVYAAQASAELAAKMGKMNSSALYFYRGTAHLFFKDMATLPASAYTSTATGYTWLSGDAHIGNFGAMKDAGGTFAFGVNDFDEGSLGQYVWDLRRAVVSVVLVGRENGISDANIRLAVDNLVGGYYDQMAAFAGNDGEKTFKLLKGNTTDVVDDTIDAAAAGTRSDLLSEYTSINGTTRRFQNKPDLIALSSRAYNNVTAAMSGYIASIPSNKRFAPGYYAVKDVHQKLGSGTGSLGRLRYYVLIEGPTASNGDDVILEVKQEAASAVAFAAPGRMPATACHSEGERALRTMKAQLLDADVLAGFGAIGTASYFFREKSPYQADFDYSLLTSSNKLKTAATYLGQALAATHALSDKDYDATIIPYGIDREVINIASKSGLKAELNAFAFSYADQVRLDWQAFQSAYAAGQALY